MHDAAGNYIGLGLDDSSDEIRKIKAFMRRKFSYAELLDDSPLYDAAMATVVSDMQWRYVQAGKLTSTDFTPGVINLATKIVMGYLTPTAKVLPVVFTVAGHLGGLFDGPAYLTAKVLEDQGRCRVQPVGYDNVAIPFNNTSGYVELDRLVRGLAVDTPFCVLSHSQGAIIATDYLEKVALPSQKRGEGPFRGFRGGIAFGNPRRPMGVVAPWVADPPPPDAEGIANDCLPGQLPNVAEVSQRGDLYADKKRDAGGEDKTAVYQAVLGRFTGTDSLAEQMWEIVTDLGPEMWAVFSAIVDGVRFAADQSPHTVFDLGPCVGYLDSLLP